MYEDQQDEIKAAATPLNPTISSETRLEVNGSGKTEECLPVQYFEFQKEETSSDSKITHLSTTSVAEKVKAGWRRYVGLAFALLCSLFFSLTVLLAKLIHQNHNVHPFVIAMWRFAGVLVPSIPITIYFQTCTDVQVFESLCPLTKNGNWRNLITYVMQGMLNCTATIFRFMSLQFIPLADSTIIFSSYSVFVTIFAHFCLGEKCGVFSIIFAFATAIGVVIISRPPILTGESEFNIVFLQGVMYALLALLSTATFIILMRKIRKTHFALIMLMGGAVGVFESGVLAAVLGVFTLPQTATEWGLVGAIMTVTFLGQTFFILAVKYENAGPLAIARTSESIYAFMWQFLFLGVVPDFISIIGGLIVIVAVICTGYRKYLGTLPIDNRTRRKLGFLLK